jgi:hypothetical protein
LKQQIALNHRGAGLVQFGAESSDTGGVPFLIAHSTSGQPVGQLRVTVMVGQKGLRGRAALFGFCDEFQGASAAGILFGAQVVDFVVEAFEFGHGQVQPADEGGRMVGGCVGRAGSAARVG